MVLVNFSYTKKAYTSDVVCDRWWCKFHYNTSQVLGNKNTSMNSQGASNFHRTSFAVKSVLMIASFPPCKSSRDEKLILGTCWIGFTCPSMILASPPRYISPFTRDTRSSCLLTTQRRLQDLVCHASNSHLCSGALPSGMESRFGGGKDREASRQRLPTWALQKEKMVKLKMYLHPN